LDQWRELLKKFNELEGRLPIYYYRPFKIAEYFISKGFTREQWHIIGEDNLYDFKDRFWDPEQIYDYVKYEKLFHQDTEYSNLKAMVNGRLILFPLTHFVYKNLFMMHLCFEKRKIGVNMWIDRHKISKSSPVRVNQQCYVHSKMLKYEGWEVLDIIYEDFVNMGTQQDRDKFLHDWYHTASRKQEQKGVFKLDIQFV
jgi:hypothetical protein